MWNGYWFKICCKKIKKLLETACYVENNPNFAYHYEVRVHALNGVQKLPLHHLVLLRVFEREHLVAVFIAVKELHRKTLGERRCDRAVATMIKAHISHPAFLDWASSVSAR